MILAVDPGLRACGCAVFSLEGPLVWAGLVKNPEKTLRGPAAHLKMAEAVYVAARCAVNVVVHAKLELVLEYPRIYVDRQRRAVNDPNDLLELAGVDGAIAAWILASKLTHYFPSDWKGQTPANPTARQVIKRLTAAETARVEDLLDFRAALEKAEAKGRDVSHSTHNTLDAVGIGLKYLGRF